MLLFVYGTLKQNYSSHSKLKGSKYLGEATTANPYLLLQSTTKQFPFLVSVPVAPITGELYEINDSTLRSLDFYEGHPDYFKRILIPLTNNEEAWCYFYTQLLPITTF